MNNTNRGKSEILLESGTNEIEIMEFTIEDELYGINVAKVKEIMMASKVKPVPHSHPAVEGIFKPRDKVYTVVDLPMYLTGKESQKQDKDIFIITNFNKLYMAFRVHTVVGISRVSWKAIQKPDKTLNRGEEGIATGIAQCGDELVTILDFEKIVSDISPETGIQLDSIVKMGNRARNDVPILLAEDSVLLSKMITEALSRVGYTNILRFNNGEEAWNYLERMKANTADKHMEEIGLIITDIEMPKMDGHRLTKLVKEDRELRRIPLVIFSSLINEEMRIKGKSLGADEQLSKPEIGHLVEIIDMLIARSKQAKAVERES
ncbi:chemotaxis protein [Proteocatella sphenisci]|uniref:chemotaxis protein n=1 Tax=Proteocatella sphenisci TaxID=181070 RepID=UPI000490C642|nr:chemotaxis protein [Proteocatella sphenisci]